MRILLQTYNIDTVGYNGSGYQSKPTQNTTNDIGAVNAFRSSYQFKFNLSPFLRYNNNRKQLYTIRLIDIYCINENGNNVIDTLSPAPLRTCNIELSGPNFLSGSSSVIIGQFSNYNPSEEVVFENVYFHRGDVSDYQHLYYFIGSGQTDDFYRFLMAGSSILNTASVRYRINSSTITQLNGKIVRSTGKKYNETLFSSDVQDAGDGTLPARTSGQVNNFVQITTLPENNQWFSRQTMNNTIENSKNVEWGAYVPRDMEAVFTITLKDILTNTVQPVVAEPNSKVYPSLNFVFEII